MSQAVHHRIGGGIARLAGRCHDGCRRRKEDEKIEVGAAARRVQVPRSRYFRRQHRSGTLPRLVRQRRIVENAGGVDDAAKRRHARRDVADDAGDIFDTADIGGDDFDLGSRFAHPSHGLNRPLGCAAARHEHQMPRSASNHPLGDDQSEAAGSAGDQIGRVDIKAEGIGLWLVCVPLQPAHVASAGPECHLVFQTVGIELGRKHIRSVITGGVHIHATATQRRTFGGDRLRGAPHRRLGEGHRAGIDALGAARDQPKPRRCGPANFVQRAHDRREAAASGLLRREERFGGIVLAARRVERPRVDDASRGPIAECVPQNAQQCRGVSRRDSPAIAFRRAGLVRPHAYCASAARFDLAGQTIAGASRIGENQPLRWDGRVAGRIEMLRLGRPLGSTPAGVPDPISNPARPSEQRLPRSALEVDPNEFRNPPAGLIDQFEVSRQSLAARGRTLVELCAAPQRTVRATGEADVLQSKWDVRRPITLRRRQARAEELKTGIDEPGMQQVCGSICRQCGHFEFAERLAVAPPKPGHPLEPGSERDPTVVQIGIEAAALLTTSSVRIVGREAHIV